MNRPLNDLIDNGSGLGSFVRLHVFNALQHDMT